MDDPTDLGLPAPASPRRQHAQAQGSPRSWSTNETKAVTQAIEDLWSLTNTRRTDAADHEAIFAAYLEALSQEFASDAQAVVDACKAWPSGNENGRWWPTFSELSALARRCRPSRSAGPAPSSDDATLQRATTQRAFADYDASQRAQANLDKIDGDPLFRVGHALKWPRGLCREVETGLFRWPAMPEGAEIRDIEDLKKHDITPSAEAPPPPRFLKGEQLKEARKSALNHLAEFGAQGGG